MACYLGIDTSNYTSSAALYDSSGTYVQEKRLLPVRQGEIGLRQSDAVFAHVKQLGELIEQLFEGVRPDIRAIGVSLSPRDEQGSYMPCFLVGELCARSLAAALGVPLSSFSHQNGHVAAALFSTGRLDLARRDFLAFHVSGGTTQCLFVEPDAERIFSVSTVAETLDLHAGQAVDRVGGMLGTPFPAGPALEKMARSSDRTFRPNPAFKGKNCCLSGLQNQCERMYREGEPPERVARYCLDYLTQTILTMIEAAVAEYPGRPLIFAGGVMSNSIIREAVKSRFDAHFAEPSLSSDNAVGTAVLCAMKHGPRRGGESL